MKVRQAAGRFGALIAVPLLGAALWVLREELLIYDWHQIRSDLGALPSGSLALALVLIGVNYLVLTGYDLLSVRQAEVDLPYPRVALASTLGFALSQTLGFPLLAGAPLRARLYGRWGVDGAQVSRIVRLSSVTFWFGALAVGGVLLTFTSPLATALPPVAIRAGGALMLGCAVAYLVLVLRGRSELHLGSLALDLPTRPFLAGQLAVATADWMLAAGAFHILLPPDHGLAFLPLVAAFVAARLLGVVSRVPGGLGVFEATFLMLMPASADRSALFATLVAFRVLYYLLPLFTAALVLVATEAYQRGHRAVRLGSALATVLPTVLSGLVFVLGAILLFVGAVPLSPARLALLERWVGPTTLNVSHFVASLFGGCLIVLARGLQRRLEVAHHLALAASGATSMVALAGFAAPVLAVAFALAAFLLWLGRDAFYRGSSLLDQAFTPRWVASILITLSAALWLGLFSFKDVTFTSDLWWRMTLNADAPRFLRGAVGVATVLLLFSLARLLRPTPHTAEVASAEELDEAAAVVRTTPRASANLALIGDKALLFSPSRRSFLMYGIQGSSWLAMGDPIGDEEEFEALLWDFREKADRVGDSTAHYQIAPEHLHMYVDLGMSLFKVGEVGRVPLPDLTLEGKTWADLRKARNRFEKLGAEFEIIPRDSVREHLPELRRVSDEWLASKNTREKGFSLGRFEDDYIARNPVAVLRLEGRIIAFASLWAGENREEVSIDLMRYSASSPRGSMDCMFGNLLLWGRDEGYRFFWLGMAPLAGLEDGRLAPLWHRFGDVLFDHGERFYNFQGLYDFKEKFQPEWESRYLAVSSLRRFPQTLADLATLVGGGLKGVLGK